MRLLPRLGLVAAFGCAGLRAESVWLAETAFAVTNDAGFGQAVFVAGSAPQLGSWDLTRAVRLRWSADNIWRGRIALPRGVATSWRPFVRGESSAAFTNPAAVVWLAPEQNATPPAPPAAPHAGKTVYYETAWTDPRIWWNRPGTGEWIGTPLETVRPGVVKAAGLGWAGRPLVFVPNNAGTQWDNPGNVPGANYTASADAVWLRGGQIFDYEPPATVSAPRFVTNNIASSYAGIPSRRVRVLLPRGYDENTAKRYPVVYFHDGQNVFDPGGAFGSWSADAIVNRDTAAGLLREMIVVAVDNTPARNNEYRPPGDFSAGADGLGDRYRDFLLNDVKPWVDAAFRVSPRREDHALVGSSLGGLITHYIGMTGDVFGLLGICSPSYWIAPEFRQAVAAAPRPGQRIWLDWGSSEGSSMWDYARDAAETLDAKGMVRGRDLQILVGAGDGHNEAAWKRRLPELLRFLLPVTDGPQPLLLAQGGIPTAHLARQPDRVTVEIPALRGWRYELRASGDLTGDAWDPVMEQRAADPWGSLTFETVVPAGSARQFFRIRIAP